jgi:hypothetical protein
MRIESSTRDAALTEPKKRLRALESADLLNDHDHVNDAVSRLMKYREEADYNPSYVFSRDEYLRLRAEVDALTALMREYLKAQGFIR